MQVSSLSFLLLGAVVACYAVESPADQCAAKLPAFNPNSYKKYETARSGVMPPQDTTYWCTIHKGPPVTKKEHVVAFEPFFGSQDAVNHIHHMFLFECDLPAGQDMDASFGNLAIDKNAGWECFGANAPAAARSCNIMTHVWAVGGARTVLPSHVGVPVGQNNRPVYYMMQTHLNNPNLEHNIRFSHGLRYFYGPQIRANDAGMTSVWYNTDLTITVPPNTNNYVVAGHCTSECTNWGVNKAGVKIVNVLLHGHMSTVGMTLRHYTGSTEHPYIAHKPHYNWRVQNTDAIKEITINPGDALTVECTYNSSWNNGKGVVGGLSAKEEMCQAWMYAYPRANTKVMRCISNVNLDQHLKELGVTKYHTQGTGFIAEYFVDEPKNLAGSYKNVTVNKVNWSNNFRSSYQQSHRFGNQISTCSSAGANTETHSGGTTATYPKNLKAYAAPRTRSCSTANVAASSTRVASTKTAAKKKNN